MDKISKQKVLEVIQSELNLSDNSGLDAKEWDSLEHLNILISLDKMFGGKISDIKGLATANTVKKIIDTLTDHALIEK